VTDITRSNSLADLAARIKREYEASSAAIKRGLDHAIACGSLLIEAKAQLPHGKWLPWLHAHCGVPERSAQLYMRLARNADEIRNVADLTVREAATLIAKADEPEPGSHAWCAARLKDPFSDNDLVDANKDWLEVKLLHHASVPAVTAICLGLHRDYGVGLCFAPINEIIETIKIMKALLDKRQSPRVQISATYPLDAWVSQVIAAQRVIVALWDEIKRREKLGTEARYLDHCQKTIKVLDERMAERRATLKHTRAAKAAT
jgi:hypothetical protein